MMKEKEMRKNSSFFFFLGICFKGGSEKESLKFSTHHPYGGE